MKRPLLTLTAIAVALASPVFALEKPVAGKQDNRIRYVDYDPANVVDLWTTPGAILTIEFADDETIAGVAVSDSHVLHSDKRKNFLILKPEGCLVPEPIVVLTNLPNGQLRRYTMQIETKPQVCGEQKPVITASATTDDPPPGNLRYISQDALGPAADVDYSVVYR
jgi:type IV secretion system protein VirB9